MTKEETISKIGMAAKNSPLELFELAYFNNPVGLVYALRSNNLTAMIIPKEEEIEKVIKRLLVKRDITDIRKVFTAFPFKTDVQNFTTNAKLWETMGARMGDFVGVFDNIAKKQ